MISSGRYIMSNRSSTQDGQLDFGEVPAGGLTELKLSITPNTSGLTGAGTGANYAREWQLLEIDTHGSLRQVLADEFFRSGVNAAAGVAHALTIGGTSVAPGSHIVFATRQGTTGYKIADPGGNCDLVVSYEEP